MHELQEFCNSYSTQMSKMIKSICGQDSKAENAKILEKFEPHKEFYVAILITGSIYGELIMGIDKKTCLQLIEVDIGEKSIDEAFLENFDEIKATFGECLNIVAGAILPDIKKKKNIEISLTIPRFYSGNLHFEGLDVAQSEIVFEQGQTIECYFYLDNMRLDIAKSLKVALKKLVFSYKKLKEAHDKIIEQQDSLIHAEKMASIGVLASGVAHSLNTPLGAISLSFNMIEREFHAESMDREKVLASIQLINKTTRKMADIIDTLREFSSNVEVHGFDKVDMSKFLEETSNSFSNMFLPDEKNVAVRIRNNCDQGLQFDGNQDALLKALLCIMQNAIEVIEASVSHSEPAKRWIKVEVNSTDADIETRISNGGEKILPENINKVFDPFWTSKDPSHPGLGLSLAKGIIEGHRGTVSIEPESQHTTFVVKFPFEKQKKAV